MSTVPFEQFQFCSLCRCSHVDKDNHIYMKKHRNLLTKILKRFSSKIAICKNAIENPTIKSLLESDQHQKKCWCYFCELELNQHVTNDGWIIFEQGLFAHLTSATHEKNTRAFFRKNCLKDFQRFLLSETDFNRHLTNTEISLKICKDEHQKKMLKEMKRIHENDRKKKMVTNFSEKNHQKSPYENNIPSALKCETKTKGKKTIAVFSSGLTCINITDSVDPKIGNIFTDALPPWLQNVEPVQASTIGPTFEDFDKHLKAQQKQKLPKERVGANFEHNLPVSDSWLPSFGQVWNNHRRLQTKQDFLRRVKRKPAVPTSTKRSVTIKPYQRKRP